ncbi:glycosyltransferase family 2 protein [Henriciella marina]|uniref:glycosyltransferase family 2 protein n=1 Tax=Henriciella marina TaxID=453851 RepID=UPI000375F96C|nr:glycosyltransferase [Henriciella marina]
MGLVSKLIDKARDWLTPALATGEAPDEGPACPDELAAPTLSPEAQAFLPDLPKNPVRPGKQLQGSPLERNKCLDTRPEVSVVLGTLNRRKLLEKCIASVREELEGIQGEIIVIDGGSEDRTSEWLVKQKDLITILQHNRYKKGRTSMRRRSWGGFMNMGFRAASADYILMISDDCLLMPGAISNGIRRIEAAKAAGVPVGACAFYFRDWPKEDRYYVQRTIGGNLMLNHGIYTREALEAVNFANEDDYVFYKSDTDLSLKIWRAGFSIIDSPESICEHYVGIEEELRAGNTALMEYDRAQMRQFWPELVKREAVAKMGKVYLDQAPGSEADKAWGRLYRQEERTLKSSRKSAPKKQKTMSGTGSIQKSSTD